MRPVAIIPARGGSKRIPRKNIIDMNGLPMLAYPIRMALKANLFEKVIVSTEDSEIKAIAEQYGAIVVDRPVEMASDTAFEIEVYAQVLESLPVKPDAFCAIYPTAIFLEAEDIRNAYSHLPGADAVMSVSRYPIHPFKALKTDDNGFASMVHPDECLLRSQTYPEYVASNGTFYWFWTESYLQHKSYYPPLLKTFCLPSTRAVDIDEPEDLALAKALLAV